MAKKAKKTYEAPLFIQHNPLETVSSTIYYYWY